VGRAKLIIAVAVVLALVAAIPLVRGFGRPYSPAQPIEYSHRLHAGEKKIPCSFCHDNAEGKTPHMLVPSAQKCAVCHRGIKADSPEVKKILAHADAGTEPPWKRVYGFPATANVYFTHVPHLRAKISCQTCHGEIERMDRVTRTVDQNMGWCIECHRATPDQAALVPHTQVTVNRLIDCAVCHR
jgi:hypothetical protein